MTRRRFFTLISVAFGSMVVAIALSFLMMLRIILPRIWLGFLSYGIAVGGLGTAFYAFTHYALLDGRKHRDER